MRTTLCIGDVEIAISLYGARVMFRVDRMFPRPHRIWMIVGSIQRLERGSYRWAHRDEDR